MAAQFNPPSWHTNGVPDTTLFDFNLFPPGATAVPTINGQPAKLYMEEVSANQSDQRDHRLSLNQGSASTLNYWMPDYTMTNTDIQKVVAKTILGGWWGRSYGGNDRKNPPMAHPIVNNIQPPVASPSAKGMFCSNIVGLKSCSPREWNSKPVNQGGDPTTMRRSANYNTAMWTLSFESLPYTVNEPAFSDGLNWNWIEKQVKATNTRISLPLGIYRYVGFPLVPALLGQWKNLPQAFVQYTFHQVQRRAFFTNDVQAAPALPFQLINGKVNDAPFDGFPAQTLLSNDFETWEYTDWLGQRMLEVKWNCIYNSIGWNRQYFPGGNLVVAVENAFPPHDAPFAQQDFASIVRTLNP